MSNFAANTASVWSPLSAAIATLREGRCVVTARSSHFFCSVANDFRRPLKQRCHLSAVLLRNHLFIETGNGLLIEAPCDEMHRD